MLNNHYNSLSLDLDQKSAISLAVSNEIEAKVAQYLKNLKCKKVERDQFMRSCC